MYPHTIEGLFEAVAKGILPDVEEVVKSGKVEVNQLHNNKHIITDLLESYYLQREQKIDFLIKSGAILQFDAQGNILVAIYKLKDLELKRTMITLIKETESFKNKYTPYHFAALEGVAPNTVEEAFVKDYFGSYPIHYAFENDAVNDNWFENIDYDFFTPIENGLYEGINLFWWLLVSPHRYRRLEQLLRNFSAGNYFKLLKFAPLNPNHPNHGLTVAYLLLIHKRYEDFTRLTQNLTAEQYYEILKSAPLNPNHLNHGVIVAQLLLNQKRYEDFMRLAQNLTAEQLYEILNSTLLNPKYPDRGLTVACVLLVHKRYKDFTRLTQNLTAEQYYEFFKSEALDPKSANYGLTVARIPLKQNLFEDAAKLVQKLTVQQRYELLKLQPLKTKHSLYIMLLVGLLEAGCYAELEMIINGLNIVQLMELLLEANIKNEQKIKNLNLLKYLAKENESLLIKILEPYEINDLLEKIYKKLRKDNIAYDPVCYVLLEKTNIALRALMQSSQNKHDEKLIKILIKDYLKTILDMYDQLAANEKYKKKANEIVGMTVSEACHLWCRNIFVEYFDSINNGDYSYIKTIDPLYALEGYGHYLRVLGCDNRDLARQLGVEYAQSKSGKNKSEKNKEPAKSPDPKIKSADADDAEELALLKRKVIELEEKLKGYEGKHTLKNFASEKNNKPESKSTGGSFKLFLTRTRPSNSESALKRKVDADVNEQVPKQARAVDESAANMNMR